MNPEPTKNPQFKLCLNRKFSEDELGKRALPPWGKEMSRSTLQGCHEDSYKHVAVLFCMTWKTVKPRLSRPPPPMGLAPLLFHTAPLGLSGELSLAQPLVNGDAALVASREREVCQTTAVVVLLASSLPRVRSLKGGLLTSTTAKPSHPTGRILGGA